MVKECETTRVPGFIVRMVGRSLRFRFGSRYMVSTVAWLKSVTKMSACWNFALPATPSFSALRCESLTMSGLYSRPVLLAPNFFAAAIAMRPSPAPRSIT